MSRRKQARPSRLLDDDEETEGGSGGGDLAGGRGCGELATKKTGSGVNNKDTDHNQVLTDKEDANNNESKEKESEDEEEDDDDELMKRENDEKTLVIQNMLSNLQWPAVSPSVTLEALQNTKVAVAQLAANALANNNGENAQDLAVLQSTLFTLQQQQLLQLQLIQQLQHQLHVSNSNSDEDELSLSSPPPPPPPPPASSSIPGSGGPQGKPENVENHHQQHHHHPRSQHPQQSQSSKSGRSNKKPRSKENNIITEDEIIDEEEEGRTKSNSTTTTTTNNNNGLKHNNNNSDGGGGGGSSSGGCGLSPAFATLLNCPNQDPNRPLSPGLQSHQINNNHLTQTDVPNTLAMLQRRTEEVLDSASQGLLASSLAADNCSGKKLGPYEKGREPFFKHRCRYCGKVFGSDSALQIHIRSHTGERPFKCNVCGSRFTTKGNLKVHFQRHTSKFPGIKMNSQPIPEHLDHFHPPLLQNNSSNPTTPEHSPQHTPSHQQPPPNPFMHHHAPFFGSLFRFDVKPPSLPFFNGSNSNKDAPLSPQDLTKPKSKTVIKKEEEEEIDNVDEDEGREAEEDEEEDKADNETGENDENSPKQEEEEERIRDEQESKDENISTHGDDEDEPENYDEEEQPENLSSKSLPLMYPLPLVARPSRPSSSSASTPTTTTNRSENSPTPMIRFHSHHHHIQQLQHQQQQQQQQQHKMMFDPAKDPAIYTNLLPRPGSNDNAWESLIEVTKASETSKLQQLVDNIEHKLTDPNMCVICRRTLSCKSALQMHYRTHTGERPFKCKICGRAFTTKGNLKTHMGVHRAKPPLRVLHQCPVCHKRFTNSLVLQQHIRLHTGEPTDLTPDQIRAAEVKDSYPPFGNPLFGTFSSMSEEEMMMNDDDSASETNESIDSEIKPTTSLAALENQVRTITTTAASNFAATNFSSPKLNSNQNITEDNDSSCSSRGVSPQAPPPPPPLLPPQSSIALDLTPPRSSSSSQIFNPFHHLPPPPLGFPASLLTPTTTANAVAALANLSSFSPLVPPPRLSETESFLWTAAAQQARGNTTCQICLKTFACNSALEIHYRSHTKERPFKCNVCQRGFSTKGNAKQHMLTHKSIRDIPASSNSSFESNKQNGLGQSDDSNKSPPESPKSHHSHTTNNNHHHHNCINNKRPASPVSPPQPTKKIHEGLPSSSSSNSEDKHLCKVCTKNFSSSSALSIHHRVHSGERPFICSVCGKAFTTKGNLKVHLGTHNQWNGASRRGRRMSLDPMTVFLPHPHHPHHHPHHQQLSHHPMLGMSTTIKSDLHLPHRPAELLFPFSNTNAQQNIFLQNGSLKSSKESPDEEDSHLDEDEESSKENGEIKSKKVLGSSSSSGGAEVETIVGGGSGGNDDDGGRVCIKEEEEEEA